MSYDRICKICGSIAQHKIYVFKEMMFGLRDEFEYFECTGCGCIQIKDAPSDMAKYYPLAYLSFLVEPAAISGEGNDALGGWLKRKRSEYFLTGKSVIGRAANAVWPLAGSSAENLGWLKKCHATTGSNILDVGCGGGALLLNLKRLGFKNLTGVDPFIEKDILYGRNPKILKNEMSGMDMKFDVVMLNHSLEHMRDPSMAFQDIARLLTRNGRALIRTPVVPSYAWEHYGESWVQLDAPRHLFIFSLNGIKTLSQKAGLVIEDIVFDSTEFQFTGSEQYLKGIPLFGKGSYLTEPENSIFSKDDVELFKARSTELNKKRTGDQFALYLSKL